MPPAVTPLSFHVTSLKAGPETLPIVVPPTAVTHGSQAGKQTWARPSGSSALPIDPLSPEAANTVTPLFDASWKKPLIAVSCDVLQPASSQAQLMVITEGDGWPALGTTAVEMAEIQPSSELVPMKYTAIVAPLATEPATSMSSATSASSLLTLPGPPRTVFEPPRIGTGGASGGDGSGGLSPAKNASMSVAWPLPSTTYPPPNSKIPMVWPEMLGGTEGKPYSPATSGGASGLIDNAGPPARAARRRLSSPKTASTTSATSPGRVRAPSYPR